MSAGPAAKHRRLGSHARAVEHRAPHSLGDEAQRSLLTELEQVSAAAFGRDLSTYWRRRGTAFFAGLDAVAIAYDAGGDPLAFTTWRAGTFGGERCVYFDATATVPGRQRAGLVPRLQAPAIRRPLARNPTRPVYHVVRTRSPVAWRLTLRTSRPGAAWPRPEGASPPAAVQAIARGVAEWLHQADHLDAATLRIRDAYAGLEGLYGDHERPRAGDRALDGFVDRLLGPDDGMLVIGRLTVVDLARFAVRTLKR
jgi:hypothetical protein